MVMEPVEDGPRQMVWGDRSVSLGQPWGAEEDPGAAQGPRMEGPRDKKKVCCHEVPGSVSPKGIGSSK